MLLSAGWTPRFVRGVLTARNEIEMPYIMLVATTRSRFTRSYQERLEGIDFAENFKMLSTKKPAPIGENRL
jgi:hypothetical protein